jgi:hypothetical protein
VNGTKVTARASNVFEGEKICPAFEENLSMAIENKDVLPNSTNGQQLRMIVLVNYPVITTNSPPQVPWIRMAS